MPPKRQASKKEIVEDTEDVEVKSKPGKKTETETNGKDEPNEEVEASNGRKKKKAEPKKGEAKKVKASSGAAEEKKAQPKAPTKKQQKEAAELIEENEGKTRKRNAKQDPQPVVEEPQEPPKKKGRSKKEDKKEPEDEDLNEKEEKPVQKKRKQTKPEKKETSEEEEDLNEKEEKPVQKKRKQTKPEKKETSEEEEDLNEKEEKPVQKKRKQTKPEKKETSEEEEDLKEKPVEKKRKQAKSDKKETVEKNKKEKEEPKKKTEETKEKKKPAKKETAKKTTAKKDPKETNDDEPVNTTTTKWENIDFKCDKKNAEGKSENFRITSWNVDGMKAWLKKGGLNILTYASPDILCLQETKCNVDFIPPEIEDFPGYKKYWCSSKKNGYAGVGLLTKVEPINVMYGISDEEQDEDGRCITAEFDKFYLVTVYVPNAGRKLVTLDKRLDWNDIFKNFIKDLDKKKPVVICGDLNVAHNEIDLTNPNSNKKNAGFTQEERDGMTDFLQEGFVDTFRELYPDRKDAYTFWTYMSNSRKRNIGWRLDYFLVSERFKNVVCDSVMYSEVYGSDHCPLTLFMNV